MQVTLRSGERFAGVAVVVHLDHDDSFMSLRSDAVVQSHPAYEVVVRCSEVAAVEWNP